MANMAAAAPPDSSIAAPKACEGAHTDAPATAPTPETEEDPIVQCIIVRKDLEWPLGALMAQACHASMAAVEENRHDEATTAYLHADNLLGMHKVVYEAKSETALQNAATKLRERGARFHAWVEQPEGIHTAIALKPYPRTVARVLCKGFRLLK